MEDCGDPIRPEEVEPLFAPFAAHGPCALAVSGGSDSTALMVLFADWLRRTGGEVQRHVVLTVDHGLRAQSAAEARAVAEAAHALGYPHTTLVWHGPKPATGVQAAARDARYRLIGECMRARGLRLVLTAHTQDDQAETLLMRLARGSGLDGLCAMSAMSVMGDRGTDEGGACRIGRPLLGVPKARLSATLKARGMVWIEDPSNAAPEFERTRLRAVRGQLDALGLTPAALALSAARLARARRALDAVVDRLCEPGVGMVRVDACGRVAIDRAGLLGAGEEIALRVLERAIAAAGGAGGPVPLGKLEPIVARICEAGAAASGRWTLARALITADRAAVQVEREPGRQPLPELTLMPGNEAWWDGRFRVGVAPGFAGEPVEVRALGAAGARDLRNRVALATEASLRAAALVPSFWLEGRLLAVPSLAWWAAPHTGGELRAAFAGLRRSSKDAGP
jgi:tRNA(Ile)-lysidine synthase